MKRMAWLLLILAAAWDPITKPDADVAAGNRKFTAGKFHEAEHRYRAAEKRLAGAPGVHFDLGAALYAQGVALPPGPQREAELKAAEKELRQALDAGDPRLRALAHYNLGNTLFRRGNLGDAIEEYKRSLKLDPAGDDARHNLELALRRKKEQQPPPPQPQQQPPPHDKKQQQQGQAAQSRSQPQQGSQGQQQPQQPQGSEPKPQASQERQQPGQGQPQPQPQPQPPQQQPQQQPSAGRENQDSAQKQGASETPPTDMTAEDLDRKLDALERDSDNLRAQRSRLDSREQRRGRRVKDW